MKTVVSETSRKTTIKREWEILTVAKAMIIYSEWIGKAKEKGDRKGWKLLFLNILYNDQIAPNLCKFFGVFSVNV